jgi:amino acid adenylation domain-containing protein
MQEKTAGEFLSFLRDLGVRLAVEGDRLACNAPKGALTPELKADLSSRKIELIEFLTNANLRGTTPPAIRKLDNRTELPLSCGQQRLWFLDLFESESRAYNISFALEVKGALNCAALESSLQEIVRRHEVLRCRIVNVNGTPKALPGTGADWQLGKIEFRRAETLRIEDWTEHIAKEESQQRFDLAAGQLFRAKLLRIDDRDHVLLLTFHHIAVDGWAIGLFVQELCLVYAAYRNRQPSPLPELALQYADFAAWQNRQLESERMQTQLEYWRKQLHGPLPVIELPTDRPRPSHPMFRGARKRFTLAKELAGAICQFSRDEKSTNFVALLSAFKVLLQRYTRQDDIVVGSAVAGRNRPELENLVGIFMNNVALRTSLSGDPTVQQLIARVRETSLNAFAHQDIPFDRVVAGLHPDRNLNRSPLFQVMFVLQNFPMPSVELPELSVRPLQIDPGTSRFDLTIDAAEQNDGSIDLYFEYSTDLFESATIDRLARHFENLVAAMVANPSQRISELQMLGADDLSELHTASFETRAEYPRETCVHELFDQQSAVTPDRIAVVCGAQKITYAELGRRSNRLANALRSLGVGPDRLVGVCLERSVNMVVAMLGVLKAGGAYVPMDPHFPKERLEFMARDSALNVLLTDEQSRDLLDVPGATVLSLSGNGDEISRDNEQAPPRIAAADDRAYVIYTSGSTGMPKGVQIAHRSVVNFLKSMQREPGLTADDCLLSVTTLSFDISGLEVFLPLITGATVVLAPRSVAADGRMLARLLSESNATVMQATPATWRLLLESGWRGEKDLRILCGGETMPRELANRLLPKCGELWNLYGPTETTIWSTLHKVTAGEDVAPIGKPIANTEVYLLDSHGQPVPPGVPGELYIGGDGLAIGYLNRPDLTAEKFVPHPFRAGERLYRTGDLARTLPGGALQFIGRLDNQVKIRGFRVELGEIEAALKRCDGVSDATVILREDVPGDQRLVAYLVPFNSAVLPPPHALRAELLKTLPEYMIPSAFVAQQSFPLTPNRKTDRAALPLPGIDSLPVAPHAFPTSENHRGIASIWKDLLNRDSVGIHDNFFDLGGHSLLLVQLQSRLSRRFGREISIVELFERPTIADMAKALTGPDADSARIVAEDEFARSGTIHA